MSQKVPQELIDEIIGQSSEDKKDLLSWSLVSRSCNLSAIAHLFCSVRVDINVANRTPDDFCQFLDNNPRIQRVVKKLCITDNVKSSRPPWTLTTSSLSDILQHAPKVKELDIRPVFWDALPGWAEGIGRYHLGRLNLECRGTPSYDAFLQILSLFTRVDTLIIHALPRISEILDSANHVTPERELQVENLVLKRTIAPYLRLYRDVLRLNKTFLRTLSLTLRGPTDEWAELEATIDEHGESLRHLELDLVGFNLSDHVWDFQKLANLRSISFIFNFSAANAIRWWFIVNFLKALPRNNSLCSITLFFTYETWNVRDTDFDWDQAFDDVHQVFPALQTVRLIWADAANTRGLYTQHAADGTSVPKTRWSEDNKAVVRTMLPRMNALGLLTFK